MNTYAVINLKTDPVLKKAAAEAADKLGISISAVLNNELRRFAAEQSVTFDIPESPNNLTAAELGASRKQLDSHEYHHFRSNEEARDFLASELA